MNHSEDEQNDAGEVSAVKKVENYLKDRKTFSFAKLTDETENMRLNALMIDIQPEEGHGGIEYRHAGEEFIYVMEGRIDIEVGDDKHSLETGQCLRFDSSIPHRLHNPGRSLARTLVVLYAPSPAKR